MTETWTHQELRRYLETGQKPTPKPASKPVEPATFAHGDLESLTVRLEALPPSQNAFNSQSMKERMRTKKAWRLVCEHYADGLPARFDGPVDIQMEVHFPKGARRYDVGNLAAAEKIMTDVMVGLRVIKNDSPDYVRRVILGPCERTDGNGYTLYTIRPVIIEAGG